MNKKSAMKCFVDKVYSSNLMTKFIINIFGYDNFNDYNYLFRMIDGDNEIIIDIYDNVSDNRFNRYIFSFMNNDFDFKVIEEGNVFVNYVSVLNVLDSDNKLLKLAYLFKIDDELMLDYAWSFLDDIFIDILSDIIK